MLPHAFGDNDFLGQRLVCKIFFFKTKVKHLLILYWYILKKVLLRYNSHHTIYPFEAGHGYTVEEEGLPMVKKWPETEENHN